MKNPKIIFAVLLFFTCRLTGQTESRDNRAYANYVQIPGSYIMTQDDKFTGSGGWISGFSNQSNRAVIELGLDEDKHYPHTSAIKICAKFDLQLTNASLSTTTFTNQQLDISFDPADLSRYKDKAQIVFPDYYKVKVYNISISYCSSTVSCSSCTTAYTTPDVYLQAKIETARTYTFDYTSTFGSGDLKDSASITDQIKIAWPYLKGATSYELEYELIDDYSTTLGSYTSSTTIKFDLDHDATRISTNKNHYFIPLTCEHGYLVYRIRPVGFNSSGQRIEGAWYPTLAAGSLSAATCWTTVIPAFPSQVLNWQSQKSFSESGKTGTGVQYLDAVGLPRQNLARLNTESKTIAQSDLFDFYGRPVIQMMPAPVSDQNFKYRFGMNLFTGTSTVVFDKLIFDRSNTNSVCSPTSFPLSSNAGVNNYYSANNSNKQAYQGYLPDAKGFPYTQVQYTSDGLNRIYKQTLPGDLHKLSSGKEVKRVYVNPEQVQVDRLFGSEAGRSNYYHRTSTADPNGQISMEIEDMYGRTVATFLKGKAPSNLDAVPNITGTVSLTESYQDEPTNVSNDDAYCKEVSKSIEVFSTGDSQDFLYKATWGSAFTLNCDASLCFHCAYDVTLSITDECGQPVSVVSPSFTGIMGRQAPYSTTISCTQPTVGYATGVSLSGPVTISFPHPGKYKIYKKICVSNAPLADYTNRYLNSACGIDKCQIYNNILNSIDFSGCAPKTCSNCISAVNSYTAMASSSATAIFTNQGPTNGGTSAGGEGASGNGSSQVVYTSTMTPQQISQAYEDCYSYCAQTDRCSVYQNLMESDFYPGTGQFAATSSLSPTWSLSIFNPTNSLSGTPTWSSVLTYNNAAGQTDFVQINGNNKHPYELSQADYIQNFRKSWAKTFLSYHPEYCKYYFYCTMMPSSVDYDDKFSGMFHSDQACKNGGYWYPVRYASYSAYKPANSCTVLTTGVDPITSLSYTSNTNFANAIHDFTTEITQNFRNTGRDIYEFSALQTHSAIASTSPPSYTLGQDICTADNDWSIFKNYYLVTKQILYQKLLTIFLNSPSSFGYSGLACMSTIPANVKSRFPSPLNALDDNFPATGTISTSSFYTTSINSPLSSSAAAVSSYTNSQSQFTSQVVPSPTVASSQCSIACNSYTTGWDINLKAACVAYSNALAATQGSVLSAMVGVCKLGCDYTTNLMGASSTAPGTVYTLPGTSQTVSTFQQVLDYYLPSGCNAIIIDRPVAYPAVNGSVSLQQLSSCKCDIILEVANDYSTSPTYSLTMLEWELFQQRYGFDLPDYYRVRCACQSALAASSWSLGHVWTTTETNALSTYSAAVDPQLTCRTCLSCTEVAMAIDNLTLPISSTYTTKAGKINHEPGNQIYVRNTLNAMFGLHTLQNYMDLYEDCGTFTSSAAPYTFSNTITQAGFDMFMYLKSILENQSLLRTHTMSLCTDDKYYLSSLFTGTLPIIPGYTYTPTQNSNSLTITISQNTTTLGTILLVKPSGYTGNWSDFIEFKRFVAYCPPPLTSGSNYGFQMLAQDNLYASVTLTGAITCTSWPVSHLSYGTYTVPTLCPPDPQPQKNSCAVSQINSAYTQALAAYYKNTTVITNTFQAAYKKYCFSTLNETFTRTYNGADEYNYTLYYYDQAGNLQRTVPPNGSDPGILTTVTTAINPTVTLLPAYSSSTAVAYKFVNDYHYDSYNNLVNESSVDGGKTVYYYDQVGRMMASQNAKQLAASNSTNVICSYSLYDDLGRTTETGQVHFGSVGSWTNSTATNFAASLTSWRDEVTRIYYDRPVSASTNTNATAVLAAFTASTQQNLRNRVSYVTYASVYTSTIGVYDQATYYSYDDHGNVIELVQHNKQLDVFNKGLNTISYEFELISGNMLKASYQKNKADQFMHKYFYDADNRLKEVYTSKDDVNWDRDAKYFYYEHGPLARVERADKKVQGSDYFYTIHGWIKAVNNDALVRSSDPGKDGTASLNYIGTYTNVNNWVAGDAMGFSLNYYNTSSTSDYKPIKTFNASDLNPLMSLSALTTTTDPFYLDNNSSNLAGDGPDLFNGNISSMNTVFIDKDPATILANNSPFPQLTAYRYDQLQRLTKMKSFRSYSTSNYTWNPGNSSNYNDAYKMNLSYDNNGNILSLLRNGTSSLVVSGATLTMDNLGYSYYNSSVSTASGTTNYNLPYNSNKLRCVTDAVGAGNYSEDIDNVNCTSYDQLATGNPGIFLAGNMRYGYDEIGNLAFDKGEYIAKIDWTVDRKVKRIWRDSTALAGAGISKPDIVYEYNPQRQRVTKIVMPRSSATGTLLAAQNWIYTYYVYDASGNVLATYDRTASQVSGSTYIDKLSLKENMIYGSSRLAIALPSSTLATWTYNFNSACSSTVGYCRSIPTTSVTPPVTPTASGYTLARYLGYKDFELTNHLGNVITTVSDRKFLEFGNTLVNDDFTSSLNGWSNATLSGGKAVVTTSVQYFAANKTFNTVPGKLYHITYSTSVPSGAVIQAEVYPVPAVPPFLVNMAAVAGTNEISFVATSAQSVLRIQKANAPGTSITYSIDNVVIDQPSGYRADIVSNTDYYPGGAPMPGRTWQGGDKYRYSHNGHEREDELFTGAQSAEYWMYDSRILRRWEMDPVTFEWQSPYAAFDNNPIYYSDLLGAASGTNGPTGGGGKQPLDQAKQPKINDSGSTTPVVLADQLDPKVISSIPTTLTTPEPTLSNNPSPTIPDNNSSSLSSTNPNMNPHIQLPNLPAQLTPNRSFADWIGDEIRRLESGIILYGTGTGGGYKPQPIFKPWRGPIYAEDMTLLVGNLGYMKRDLTKNINGKTADSKKGEAGGKGYGKSKSELFGTDSKNSFPENNKPAIGKTTSDTVIKNNPGSSPNGTDDTLYLQYDKLEYRNKGKAAEAKKFKTGNNKPWTILK